MAIQVLPRGLTSGDVLSQGFGTGLQALAQSKMSQMQRNQQMSALSNLTNPNLSPEQRLGLVSLLPEALQRPVLENIDQLLSMGQGPASPFQAQDQNLGEMVGEGEQRAMQQQQAGQQPTQRIGNLFTSKGQQIQQGRLDVERQKLVQRQQMAVNDQANKYLKEVKKDSVPAQKIQYTVNNIMDLLDSGEAQTGLKGRLLPKELQNETTQVLRTAINDLVLAKAAAGTGGGKGVMSKARLALEQLSKPDIWQKPGAIRRNLNNIINDPTLMQALAESQASQELKQQWGGSYPRDYESQIESRAHDIIKEQKAAQNQKKEATQQNLIIEATNKYPPAQYEGQILDDADTGLSLISENGEWKIHKG